MKDIKNKFFTTSRAKSDNESSLNAKRNYQQKKK